jgi:phage baseplate assembly protein gpV
VENLFQTGDQVIRIEHGGLRSRLICWRVWRDAGDSWQFQLESSDEQAFFLIPFNFLAVPLWLVYEGEQTTFHGRNNI